MKILKLFNYLPLFTFSVTINFLSAQELASANNATPVAVANEAASNTKEENPPVGESKGKLSFSGYFDTYYSINLNNPSSRNNLGSSGVSRGFDRYSGQFQLGMFLTRTSYSYKNTEVVGEIGFGPNMEYGSYGSDFRYKWGTAIANNTYTAILIKQAYINYKPTEKLTLTAGQFGTHIGNEYIDAPLNFHYSISNLFNSGIPFYHLGLKGTYAFNSKVSLMAGIVNGTDNINDNNRGKSFIGQLTLIPKAGLTIYLNTIQGNEGNAQATGKDTTSYFGVLDLVAIWQATKKLSVTAWLMMGTVKGDFQGGTYFNKSTHWSGANLYLAYNITNKFALGTRLEYFDNSNGVRALLTQGKGTDVKTYTLTANFTLADGHLLIKPEVRFDDFKKVSSSLGEKNSQQFLDSKGNFSKHTQATIGMAAIYKF